MLTADDLKALAKPFDENTIGIKVQSLSKDKTKAMLIAYLPHQDAYQRLDEVDPGWSSEVTQVLPMGELVTVRVRLTVKGVTRENAGEGDDLKTATSDAIKRAAMLFGCGRYLYDAEGVWVPYDEQRDRYKSFTYADYKRAAKPNQSIAPVSGPALVPPPASEAPAAAPTPKAAKKNDYVAPKTRTELGKAIFQAKQALGLSDAALLKWVAEDFNGKKPDELSIEQMAQFNESLQKEVGRAG
jgi:hypothetical protein